MIVIDTSAIIAILKDEPERRSFTETIERADTCLISAANYVEASIVLEARNGYEGLRDFDLFLLKAGIIIETVDSEQAKIARSAFGKFGKGRHKAGLNFGDCFSYALAKTLGVPLLFKGDDFSFTDLQSAVNA
jgi:ribonuclease VapC